MFTINKTNRMRNLFVGILHRDEEIDWFAKFSKSGLQVAANNFQWSFIQGLEANLNQPIDIISTLSMGSYPIGSRKLFVKSKTINAEDYSFFKYVGYVNFYLIKGLCRFILLFFTLKKWIKNNPNGNIYVYSLYLPYLWALLFTKRYRRNQKTKYCLIIPDLMGKYGMQQPLFTINGFWKRIESRFIYSISREADCFVFLTKQMAEPMKIGNKPYTVIEGLITKPQHTFLNEIKDENQTEKKILLYTGSLLNDFGIETLLKSFLKIPKNNFELWLCGPVNESKTVVEYSQIDSRIKYWGFLRKDEVAELQKKTTVLINPRPNIGEYVKYSFPSKTMEYLLSGKPVIMFKLDGIPSDYYDYIYFIDKNDEDSIAQTIISVCERSDEELIKFGNNAQKFVIENKNSKIQTEKAIMIVEGLSYMNSN